MATLRYDRLPQSLRGAAYRYVEYGILPGDFLIAVLSNDLKEACARADDDNRNRLFDIVSWFYNEAPSPCWGSPEKVRVWVVERTPARAVATAEEVGRWDNVT